MSQHICAPAVAKVAKGDKVKVGELIAEAAGFVSANIHAPVSGTVTGVDMPPNGRWNPPDDDYDPSRGG